MGRPIKDADHVLARLRKAISTPGQPVTRKMLAARIGVSASTIREIETGKFRLSEAVARRLMLGTGVSPQSLLKGEDPLKDLLGYDLGPDSHQRPSLAQISPAAELGLLHLMEAGLQAAKEKGRAQLFYALFEEWLPQALEAIGATEALKARLDRTLGGFDPQYVPEALQPKQPAMKRRWQEAHNRLIDEAMAAAGARWVVLKGDRSKFYLSIPDKAFDAYAKILEANRKALKSP